MNKLNRRIAILSAILMLLTTACKKDKKLAEDNNNLSNINVEEPKEENYNYNDEENNSEENNENNENSEEENNTSSDDYVQVKDVKGIGPGDLHLALIGESITANGQTFKLDRYDDISSISFINKNVDEQAGTEHSLVELEFVHLNSKLRGNVNVDLVYDSGEDEWKVTNLKADGPFTVKDGESTNPDDYNVTSILQQVKDSAKSEDPNDVAYQDILDLQINSRSFKGGSGTMTYTFDFDTKAANRLAPKISKTLTVVLKKNNSGLYTIQSKNMKFDIPADYMNRRWSGTYTYANREWGLLEITIKKFNPSNGTFTGSVFCGRSRTGNEQSYNIKGTLDGNLNINIQGTDWIIYYPDDTFLDLSGKLNIYNSKIERKSNGSNDNYFVERTESF